MVAPYTGAWIEIRSVWHASIVDRVAPYTGAWIEIRLLCALSGYLKVAPYTGAWIEIRFCGTPKSLALSHPTRVRGLKYKPANVKILYKIVAPYTGAWIEMACEAL